MPATDTTIWDYVVTYGGPSLFMTAVFVVVMPLVYFKFARPRYTRWPSRLAVMLAAWLSAWLVAYGDVLWIAREAKRVCETEAGLRVYATKQVDGFAGVSSFEPWLEKGFKFTEEKQTDGTYIRHERVGSVIKTTRADRPRSEYEFSYKIAAVNRHLSLDKRTVQNISTGEAIAEQIDARIYPGWIDSVLVRFAGARFGPGYCANRSFEADGISARVAVINAALLPKE